MILVVILAIAVIGGSAFTFVQVNKNQTTDRQSLIEQQTNYPPQTIIEPGASPTVQSTTNTTQSVTFTGNITKINTGCWADGIFSVKVADKWVVTEIGGLRIPNSIPEIRGNLIGINLSQDVDKYIGERVDVYAKQTGSDTFTIYGDEGNYIKLLE